MKKSAAEKDCCHPELIGFDDSKLYTCIYSIARSPRRGQIKQCFSERSEPVADSRTISFFADARINIQFGRRAVPRPRRKGRSTSRYFHLLGRGGGQGCRFPGPTLEGILCILAGANCEFESVHVDLQSSVYKLCVQFRASNLHFVQKSSKVGQEYHGLFLFCESYHAWAHSRTFKTVQVQFA